MTPTDEDFIHYVDCIDSLNRAWSILQDLGSVERPSAVRAAAFLFALVEYAKPYTRSVGVHGRRKGVITLIERTLEQMYVKRDELLQALHAKT